VRFEIQIPVSDDAAVSKAIDKLEEHMEPDVRAGIDF
jgi:hypothetical protein